jgi:hypothetical protein
MPPSFIQQLAMQAKLNMFLGRDVYDRLFLGVEFGDFSRGFLHVRVRSEFSADQIEAGYLPVVAATAESILGRPVRYVNVLPKSMRGQSAR